jgi:hypothetical protein
MAQLAETKSCLSTAHIDGVRRFLFYLNARSGEVWDLKLDLDGWFAFRFLAGDAGKTKVRPHQIFFTAL